MNYSLPLFAYGTLMFPQIIRTVIDRVPSSVSAVAHGYARLEVIGQSFPGMVEATSTPGATVSGMLYENLTPAEWQLLNDYESTFYVLSEIEVECDGHPTKALTYLVAPSEREVLSDSPWEEEAFRKKYLDTYFTAH